MKIYNYSPVTKEYLNEGVAELNPRVKDTFLVPSNATTIEPPTLIGQYQKQVFDEATKTWNLVPDYRGSIFYKITDGSEIVIIELGKSPDNTMTNTPCPTQYHEWGGASWILDLTKLKTKIVRMLKGKTTSYICRDNETEVFMPIWRQTSWSEFMRLYDKKQTVALNTEEQAYVTSMLDAGETEAGFYAVCNQAQQWVAQVRDVHNITQQQIIDAVSTNPSYYEGLVTNVAYPAWIGY